MDSDPDYGDDVFSQLDPDELVRLEEESILRSQRVSQHQNAYRGQSASSGCVSGAVAKPRKLAFQGPAHLQRQRAASGRPPQPPTSHVLPHDRGYERDENVPPIEKDQAEPGSSDYGNSSDFAELADTLVPYAGGTESLRQVESTGLHRGNRAMLGQEPAFRDDDRNEGEDDADQLFLVRRAEVAELADERDRLQAELGQRTGEVSFVRTEIERIRTESQKAMARMNMEKRGLLTHSDEKRRALEDKIKILEANLAFKDHELAENERRVQKLAASNRREQAKISQESPAKASFGTDRVPSSCTVTAGNSQASPFAKGQRSAPRKKGRTGASFSVSDGFADEEIRSSNYYPGILPIKPGTKRKRDAVVSKQASMPPTSQAGAISVPDVPEPMVVEQAPAPEDPLAGIDFGLLERLSVEDDKATLYEAIRKHKLPNADETVVAALSRYQLPASRETLGFEIMDVLMSLRTSSEHGVFSTGVFKVLISMIDSCMTKGLLGPLSLLLDLFQFVMHSSKSSAFAEVYEPTLNVMQRIVDINTLKYFEKKYVEVESAIDNAACLIFLRDTALVLKEDERCLKWYWHAIRFDFYMMLLTLQQPMEHIRHCLSWIRTSVFSESFGSISRKPEDQVTNQEALLDFVSRLISENPREPQGVRSYTRKQLLELRTDACMFLHNVAALYGKGKEEIIAHPKALPRIVMRLASELDKLYDWRRGENQACAQFINRAVRLLHALVMSDAVSCSKKIGSGAEIRKHLVTVARLSYSNGVGQEAFLDSDIRDLAWEMLGLSIAPDESEALEKIFTPSDYDGSGDVGSVEAPADAGGDMVMQ